MSTGTSMAVQEHHARLDRLEATYAHGHALIEKTGKSEPLAALLGMAEKQLEMNGREVEKPNAGQMLLL